jgi:hypothetical protein
MNTSTSRWSSSPRGAGEMIGDVLQPLMLLADRRKWAEEAARDASARGTNAAAQPLPIYGLVPDRARSSNRSVFAPRGSVMADDEKPGRQST